MFKKIKKSVAVFAVLLLMSSGLNADCYDEAFDAMEDAFRAGMSELSIKTAGEFYYCNCEPSCNWE